jgi:hypothetical protein
MKLKYPKFLLLILTYILAYLILQLGDFLAISNFLTGLGHVGSLIAGFFYSYGFTSGPAAAVLILISESNSLILAAITAGVGALLGDLFIFRFIRSSFADEVEMLAQEKFFRLLVKKIPTRIRNSLAVILGAIIIGSPLPDEIGVFIISAGSKIKGRYFMPLSYVLNTTGIYIILLLAK